jgi:hypothetical protein
MALVPGWGACFHLDGMRAAFLSVALTGILSFVLQRVLRWVS